MVRGTFDNVRLENPLAEGRKGGYTKNHLTGKVTDIHTAAMDLQQAGIPAVILAGTEYGTGSSRDWAAKGTALLGVKAVIAESFERIHRTNLVGMGVLPLEFQESESMASLGLTGHEEFDIIGLSEGVVPGQELKVIARDPSNGSVVREFTVISRIDTQADADIYTGGGIMPKVVRDLRAAV
jgi:aconitate hydratase